jgi:hypothetical protein
MARFGKANGGVLRCAIDGAADLVEEAGRGSGVIYFLLNRELGDKQRPFRRDYVLAQDPDIQEFTELPMPWDG